VLRRERRTLHEAREQELRDLGGILLEMFKQNRFRQELLEEHCERLLEIDRRLFEIDSLLSALRRGLPPGRCACGAPLVWGSHFCANCGRSLGDEPVVACDLCGHALAAGAAFCSNCGTAVAEPPLETIDVEPREIAAADAERVEPEVAEG
jgi:hypothetical protein